MIPQSIIIKERANIGKGKEAEQRTDCGRKREEKGVFRGGCERNSLSFAL